MLSQDSIQIIGYAVIGQLPIWIYLYAKTGIKLWKQNTMDKVRAEAKRRAQGPASVSK